MSNLPSFTYKTGSFIYRVNVGKYSSTMEHLGGELVGMCFGSGKCGDISEYNHNISIMSLINDGRLMIDTRWCGAPVC